MFRYESLSTQLSPRYLTTKEMPRIGQSQRRDKSSWANTRWDVDARKWFVPNDVDRNLFKKWWPTMKGEESVEDVENFCNG